MKENNEEYLTEEDLELIDDIELDDIEIDGEKENGEEIDSDNEMYTQEEIEEIVRDGLKILVRERGRPKEIEDGVNEREVDLMNFARLLKILQNNIGKRKLSSRGWCYIFEGYNWITKDQFNKCQTAINDCRKKGYLPIDFVLEDENRRFYYDDDLDIETEDACEYIKDGIEALKKYLDDKDDVPFWKGNKYYCECVVEKIDLVHLFKPICKTFHIALANMRGWSDLTARNN